MGSGDQGSGAMFLAVMSGFKVGRRLAGGARKRNKPSSPERDMRGWGEKEKKSPLFSCQWKHGMGKETFKSPVGRLAVRLRRGIALPLPISAAPPFYSPAAGREKSAMAGRRDPSQQLCIGTQGESESPRSAHLSCSGSKRVAVDFICQDWARWGVQCKCHAPRAWLQFVLGTRWTTR